MRIEVVNRRGDSTEGPPRSSKPSDLSSADRSFIIEIESETSLLNREKGQSKSRRSRETRLPRE